MNYRRVGICPYCNKYVFADNPDAEMVENGRGLYKKTIVFHKTCYTMENNRIKEDNLKKGRLR